MPVSIETLVQSVMPLQGESWMTVYDCLGGAGRLYSGSFVCARCLRDIEFESEDGHQSKDAKSSSRKTKS